MVYLESVQYLEVAVLVMWLHQLIGFGFAGGFIGGIGATTGGTIGAISGGLGSLTGSALGALVTAADLFPPPPNPKANNECD